MMTTALSIHEIGFAMLKKQLNDQLCLQISLSEEELAKIPRHSKDGKKFIDVSIRLNTLQMCMEGRLDFTRIGYCPNYFVNDKVPLNFGSSTFDSEVNWGWNEAVPIARSEIQLHDEVAREFSRDVPKLE